MLVVAPWLGWIGAVSVVVGYALVSQRRWQATSIRFQMVNVVGAALLAVSALSANSWPSFASNMIWALVGAQALVNSRGLLHAGAVNRYRALRQRATRARLV